MKPALNANIASPSKITSSNMASVKWYAYRIYESIGLGGRMATLMLLGGLIFYFGSLVPMQEALLQIRQAGTDAKTQPAQDPQQLAMQDLQGYVAAFPKQTERANQINAMMALAKKSKLLLDEVTYKSKHTEGAMLVHTIVEFSVLDSYPNIYQYLDSLLVEMPFVALDSLSFNRADVTDDIVEARVRLIFYFGA